MFLIHLWQSFLDHTSRSVRHKDKIEGSVDRCHGFLRLQYTDRTSYFTSNHESWLAILLDLCCVQLHQRNLLLGIHAGNQEATFGRDEHPVLGNIVVHTHFEYEGTWRRLGGSGRGIEIGKEGDHSGRAHKRAQQMR